MQKPNPAGVVMSSAKCAPGPPPQQQFPPQPMPMPTLTPQVQVQFVKSSAPAPMPGMPSTAGRVPPTIGAPTAKGINQNKNPNIGLNMKNGIEITQNPKNYDKLSENLRNISNMINNPGMMMAPVPAKPPPASGFHKKPEEAWEKK